MQELREANEEMEILFNRIGSGIKENSRPEVRRDLIVNMDWEKMADRFLVLEKDESLRREVLSLEKWRELERRKNLRKESLIKLNQRMLKYSETFLSESLVTGEGIHKNPIHLIGMERVVNTEMFHKMTQSLSTNKLAFLLFQSKIKMVQSENEFLLSIQSNDNDDDYYIYLSLSDFQ